MLKQAHLLGILAILDADFDLLEQKADADADLFFTDTHDLETMILQSSALDDIFEEYGSERKIMHLEQAQGKNIRELLLECGKPLGYLRWVSERKAFSLS